MKRLLVIAGIIVLVSTGLFAANSLSLSLGAAATLREPFDIREGSFVDPEGVNFDDLTIGGDVRLNSGLLEFSAFIQGGVQNDAETGYEEVIWIDGYYGIGASVKLLDSFIDLAVTAGPLVNINILQNNTTECWGMNGSEPVEVTNAEQIKYLPLNVRATVDFDLGGYSVGGFLMIDTNASFADLMDPDFEPTVNPYATAGITFLLNL